MSYFRTTLDEKDPSNLLEYERYKIIRVIENYNEEYNDGSIIYDYDYKYTVISKYDNIALYTSCMQRSGSYDLRDKRKDREPFLEDCEYRGKAYFFWPQELYDEIDFDDRCPPKLNLPLVICMNFENDEYQYIVLWTKKEQYKIINEYFSSCKWTIDLICLIFDYSVYPTLF